ncbi:G5 domain-containing protein [Paenibacillus faecalis]|uniref:G5 domain-containing protein n=1 Tax=Paenibacillus faecalis TaxID=2079532 RepID=UPI000D0E79BC|nr:3D domain-containing protein [Paenibacillus faecalis]
MGIIQQEETHESQSSSMSYALRWKHENLRHLMLAAIGAMTITVLVLLFAHNWASKEIQLVVDGRVTTVETKRSMLHEVLDEQAISLLPQDKVSMPLNSELEDGDRIIINRAVPVKVTADGKVNTVFTTQDTVEDVLKESGISIKGEDIVKPSLETEITDNTDIRVVRVTKQKVKQTENRPFRVIKTADPSLEKGDNRVIQSGKPGVVVNHVEKVYNDGKLVSKEVVGKEVQRKTQDKIIAVGTKKAPEPEKPAIELVSANKASTANANAKGAATKASAPKKSATKTASTKTNANNVISRAGVDFQYKKVLKNVSMTAYSAEQKGIGTRTASGTRVTEGRTIAVDPNVIPIGWWVYIEGVGFRRAEDTGGAIKGNKIDVYFDTVKSALNFGRKSGHTVYVIGPVKPEIN